MINQTDHDGNDLVPGCLYVAVTLDGTGRPIGKKTVRWSGLVFTAPCGDGVDEPEYDYLLKVKV